MIVVVATVHATCLPYMSADRDRLGCLTIDGIASFLSAKRNQ